MPAIDSAYTVINSIPLVEQSSTPTTPASGKRTVFVKSDGVYDVDDAGTVTGPFGVSGAGTLNDYICIQDQKTQNTAGGTFTSGAWRVRDLNTEVSDTGNHASVASNQITLAAGTYRCHISVPGAYCGSHQAILYNTSDAAVTLIGTSEYAHGATGYGMTRSHVAGMFIIAAPKVFEVQHQCSIASATFGLGDRCNFTTEVYTIAEFWKVA